MKKNLQSLYFFNKKLIFANRHVYMHNKMMPFFGNELTLLNEFQFAHPLEKKQLINPFFLT